MRRSGTAELYLHGGRAPPWLFNRMVRLGGSIMTIMVDEYGRDGTLLRLSDPLFFQGLSNVLGFDWNSSGTTTVLCGVLQTVFRDKNLGITVVGGKGKRARETQKELVEVTDSYSFTEKRLKDLQYASRMTAKVDNTAIQDNYRLYHHAMLVSNDGEWAVIQQGMNPEFKAARRYHWLSGHMRDFVEEPHDGIVCDQTHREVLDLTAKNSQACKETIVDLVRDPVEHVVNEFEKIKPGQQTLHSYSAKKIETYRVPKRINWTAVERAYELQPRNFEGLLAIEGVGPATVRGLALVSELVYGEKPSWKDPVKYSFAFGGKDGVPFPVKRKEYDMASEILEDAIKQSKLGDSEKIKAIRRLKSF